jgi:type IV pilus assembly PilO-like protein
MSKVPTSAKAGVLLAALVVALLVGWFVVIAPKRSEASKLSGQIDDARTALAVAQGAAGGSGTPGPVIRVADLFKLSRAMPDRADIPSVLLQLSEISAETGVSFQAITPHDPVQLGAYQQIGIDLVFQGHFYDLSDFLYRLRNLVSVHGGVLDATGRLFSVNSITFDEGDLQFPQVKATLSVSAYVFGDGTLTVAPTASAPTGQAASATTTPATTTPATEAYSQPIPAAPPGATAVGVHGAGISP